ncbi:MAG TPA: C4-type zinc ribbon domain-containing protein [Bacteroidia bacterium]|nr:C4-type zinc ribbon domain-containing protein [Bacteroidia bacterium]
MAKAKSHTDDKLEVPVEAKLKALCQLQEIDSKIDKIRTVRGELPIEVNDLEDIVTGLQTRLENFEKEIADYEQSILDKKNTVKESNALIKKYEGQQNKVRNNREYDSITKELEFQNLEIQLSEKRIKEYKAGIAAKKEIIEQSADELAHRKKELKQKKSELEDITKETEKEEAALLKKSKVAESLIEDRLLSAYKRIRSNAINGLGVVSVQRDACGGCFNKIPPQRQLDISMHKKVIVCEHCGRILVDEILLSEKSTKVTA